MQTEELSFRDEVAAGAGVELTEPCPFDGIISKVLRHYPSGCNSLVRVVVGIAGRHIFPKQGFVALDDATPVYDGLSIPITMGELIWTTIENTDSANAHTITVTVTVEEVPCA